jgi:hypothetical protein
MGTVPQPSRFFFGHDRDLTLIFFRRSRPHSIHVPLMRFLPSFAAEELMEVADEAAVFRDDDRYRGLQWNLSVAMNAKRGGFLRE